MILDWAKMRAFSDRNSVQEGVPSDISKKKKIYTAMLKNTDIQRPYKLYQKNKNKIYRALKNHSHAVVRLPPEWLTYMARARGK